jgi:hypothetical protein
VRISRDRHLSRPQTIGRARRSAFDEREELIAE